MIHHDDSPENKVGDYKSFSFFFIYELDGAIVQLCRRSGMFVIYDGQSKIYII